MTNQNRVNAGEPTGGQFSTHDRAESPVGLEPVATFKLNCDLEPGDVITCGNAFATVQNAEPSSIMRGMVAVETELGTLYLGDAGESQLAASGTRIFAINPDQMMDPDDFSAVLSKAYDDDLIFGTYFTRDSVENQIQATWSDEDVDLDALSGAVFDQVRASGALDRLTHGDASDALWGRFADAVDEAVSGELERRRGEQPHTPQV